MIPKVFHSFWVQGGPLPPEFQVWSDTWLAVNPDWEHHIWSEPEYVDWIENREIYDTAVNHAQRTEIAQKEVLWRYGGCYIDADTECFRPVDELFEGKNHVVTFDESHRQLGNQFIATPPEHPAIRVALEDIPRAIRWQRKTGYSQTYGAGPQLIQRLWRNRDDVEILGPEYFHPYLYGRPKPDNYGAASGAHQWAASWK